MDKYKFSKFQNQRYTKQSSIQTLFVQIPVFILLNNEQKNYLYENTGLNVKVLVQIVKVLVPGCV